MRAVELYFRSTLGVLLIAMVLLNVANAFGRYVFAAAIPGSDEVLVFAMVWVVFAGAVLVTARDDHLGFDLLSRTLSRRLANSLKVTRLLLTGALTGYVAWHSWSALAKLDRIDQRSMATEIPMTLPHAALFLALVCICAVSLWLGWRTLLDARRRGDTV